MRSPRLHDRFRRDGEAVTEGSDPVHFDGWLELLRVVSELVAAAGGEDTQVIGSPVQGNDAGS
jgi:hypothetical protein